jgi:hypothetical protein
MRHRTSGNIGIACFVPMSRNAEKDFSCFRRFSIRLKQLKQTEPLRDIALKHRLSRSAQGWNRGEKDVYFCAGRREDRAGVGPGPIGAFR